MSLKGKTLLICVTGGIAAYKMPNLVSLLVKAEAEVHVILTHNGAQFIPPAPFEALTGNRCLMDTFERSYPPEIHHIALAKKADLVLIAPASADIIGKLANGIADDMLTSTLLACRCPRLFAPAMNTHMLSNPVVQDNIEKMSRYGYTHIASDTGHLACGDTGSGKMPEPQTLFRYIEREIAYPKDLIGQKILVTAGPTQEAIDPVRYITNHSSGKMGYAIAEAAMLRGAEVTLITGKTALTPPPWVTVIPVVTTADMFAAVTTAADTQDVIIKAAAPADYTPVTTESEKIKKTDGTRAIALKRTEDILAYLGAHRRPGQILCGFCMETEHLLERARRKLSEKHVDLIAANSLKVEGAGFEGDTNVLTLITPHSEIPLGKMPKDAAAHALLDEIVRRKSNITSS